MEPLCDASSQCEQDSQLLLLLTRCSMETSTGNLRWICAHWLPSRVCCCFAQGSCVGFGKSCCRQGWLMIKAGECWHHSTSLSFLFVEFFVWTFGKGDYILGMLLTISTCHVLPMTTESDWERKFTVSKCTCWIYKWTRLWSENVLTYHSLTAVGTHFCQ